MEGKTGSTRARTVLFLTIIYSGCALLAYSSYMLYRVIPLYSYAKSKPRGWVGKTHQADEELGFAPIPGSRGAEVFNIGPEVPRRFDNRGFRVPVDFAEGSSQPRPLVLALGGSFTYGAACVAENTYPYLVGRLLGGSSINAAVAGYGLSQMLILARRLIPTHEPDYVLVQYTPWLTSRAQSGFVPTSFGKLPTPYFLDVQDHLELHPPLFRSKLFDIPFSEYRATEKSISDFISFQLRVALPLFVHEDLNMAVYNTRKFLEILPPPADSQKIEEAVYNEIVDIAEENGAEVIVVLLNAVDIPVAFSQTKPLVAKAYSALRERIEGEATQMNYDKHYGHWRGSPPKLVDEHPNARAHSIIAEEVVRTIRDREGVREGPRSEAGDSGQRIRLRAAPP